MDSYTKEHSAEYQSQALIDLAFRMREQIDDLEKIEKIVIHTSHHTHYVIGTGANDPQKMDPRPAAKRWTTRSCISSPWRCRTAAGTTWTAMRRAAPAAPIRCACGTRSKPSEDPEWTRRYRSTDPNELAFGGRVEITLEDGSTIDDELAMANAHPLGARPFGRDDYIRKFRTLTEGIISAREANRFLEVVQDLPRLAAESCTCLTSPCQPAGWRKASPAFSEQASVQGRHRPSCRA